MSQISLQNLKKSFGKTQVIHDLSIDIKDGELIVIVGPSDFLVIFSTLVLRLNFKPCNHISILLIIW